ncbi:hypothetical protein K1719_030979 [Acacia pycnantha]|nr:hypothetical protein K1719_030979 [Acacia pycnantha]
MGQKGPGQYAHFGMVWSGPVTSFRFGLPLRWSWKAEVVVCWQVSTTLEVSSVNERVEESQPPSGGHIPATPHLASPSVFCFQQFEPTNKPSPIQHNSKSLIRCDRITHHRRAIAALLKIVSRLEDTSQDSTLCIFFPTKIMDLVIKFLRYRILYPDPSFRIGSPFSSTRRR